MKLQNAVIEAIRILDSPGDFNGHIQEAFGKIGRELKADRVYIFAMTDSGFGSTHEWDRRGVPCSLEVFRTLDLKYIRRWLPILNRKKTVLVSDVRSIEKKYPDEYEIMRKWKIVRYYEIPLIIGGNLIGILGIDNPQAEKMNAMEVVLPSFGYVLSGVMSREEESYVQEKRYAAAIRGARLTVWEYDIPGKRILLSPGLTEEKTSVVYGMGNEGILENVPDSMEYLCLEEEDRREFRRLFSEIAGGADSAEADIWFRRTDNGKPQCEHAAYYVVKDAEGKPQKAFGVSHVITAEKLEEKNFQRAMQNIISLNPESLGAFEINLTANLRGKGHGTSTLIMQAVRGQTYDSLVSAVIRLIPEKADKEKFRKTFGRRNLLASFESGRTSLSAEYRRKGEDGLMIWVRTYASMLRNPETGDISGVLYSMDISREKRQEEIIRIITGQAYDFVALVSMETGRFQLLHALSDFKHEFGDIASGEDALYDLKDLLRTALTKVQDPEKKKKYARFASGRMIAQSLERDGYYEYMTEEIMPSYRSGTTCHKFQNYYLSREDRTALVLASDVTEAVRQQKDEAEAAKAETEHMNDLLNFISSGISIMHMPDPDHLVVDYVNLQTFLLLKYDLSVGVAQRPSETRDAGKAARFADAFLMVHEEDRERVRRTFHDHYHSKHFRIEPFRMLCADGSSIWVEVRENLRDITKEGRIFYASFRDVTEEKRMQDELAANFEMEKKLRNEAIAANAAKSNFLSRISHDIRTPMNVIKSKTDFAFEDIGDMEKLVKDLQDIRTANHFLLSLINDILDISKIDSGVMELHPEPYACRNYEATIRAMFEPLCRKKKIHFVMRNDGEDCTVLIDKVRLDQVTLNLISNAVKYTPEGGTVAFTRSCTLRADGMRECTICVKDSGIGMSKEFQKVMFDSFTRETDGWRKTLTEQGTGLGLSIVKKILDMMNSTIEVESSPGKGTKMTVRFVCPDVPEEVNAVRETQPAAPESDVRVGKQTVIHTAEEKNPCILLAEDHDMNAEIAQRLLKKTGFESVRAEDGKKAAEIFRKSPKGTFAAILMDIQMPVMNGYEATKAIRAMRRRDAKDVPIIAMTADAFEEDIQKCLDAGMNAHIAKPIDPVKMGQTIRETIAERQQPHTKAHL